MQRLKKAARVDRNLYILLGVALFTVVVFLFVLGYSMFSGLNLRSISSAVLRWRLLPLRFESLSRSSGT